MSKSLISLFIIVASLSLNANEQVLNKFGLYAGYNFNIHSGNFSELKNIPNCCPEFESGTGSGYNLGLLYQRRLSNELWLSGRLGLTILDGLMVSEEPTTVNLETGPVEGAFEHKMDGMFQNIGFELLLDYNIIRDLYFSLGTRLSYNSESTFEQSEVISEPNGTGTFSDEFGNDTHSRTRNEFSGDLPEAVSFQIFAVSRLSYELPLNSKRSLLIAPELSYYFPFTELVENTEWKVNSLSGALAIKYVPQPEQPKQEIFEQKNEIDTLRIEKEAITENTFSPGEPIIKKQIQETDDKIITTETIIRTDTIFTKKHYALAGEITAVGVDEFGNEITNPKFKIEEYISSRLDPLLNYVFFDENSSQLPNRYYTLNNTKDFNVDSLYHETTLDIYYNLLNIVGSRMQQYPDANLTVTGCNSDMNSEKGNLELSRNRAEAVKVYLTDAWGIDEKRIITEARNLPTQPSTPSDNPDKIDENRRAELSSDDYRILEPVFIEKIERKSNPPIVRFKVDYKSEAGLKEWEISAYQENAAKDKFVKKGYTEIKGQIDWQLEDYQKIIPKHEQNLIYTLSLQDSKGNQKKISEQTLPIEVISIQEKVKQKIGDYEIDKYSLILFSFDEAKIESNHEKIISFIKDRLQSDSEVEILGYTDRTGESAHNQALSENRAKATQKALDIEEAFVSGVGEDDLLYTNDLPEGRFYCRTVQIIVKTKIK